MLSVRELSLSFGGPPLFDRALFQVRKGEKIALIGRNGEGKSTLLKVIAGHQAPDQGEFERSPGLICAYLPQDIPDGIAGTAADVIAGGLYEAAHLHEAYRRISHDLEQNPLSPEARIQKLSDIQHELENLGAWDLGHRVDNILQQIGIDGALSFEAMSGGMKRRVLLGRELMREPDLLLLDEPTNHLDFASIHWLENFISRIPNGVIFVTHDRVFLRKVATRILELDRGALLSFDCDYDTYLRRKNDQLDAEATRNSAFDKKLSQEEAWLRQGIKARRTRNEGRVRALKRLREERSQRRELRSGPEFSIQEGGLTGRKVITVENLCYDWGREPIIKDFNTTIWRGDKIGVIGPNGGGKTTLLKLLLGELEPKSGAVTHGTNLEVATFDQHREGLNPEATVKAAVSGDDDHVIIHGQKRHIHSYLEEFLFTASQVRGKVGALSGGERNRLQLARMFTSTANVLVLDEPTNDLDLESLELLEELLFQYEGTLLLVSHDRHFLNRVVTQTFALEPGGNVRETVGGYDEYEQERQRREIRKNPTPQTLEKKADSRSPKPRYRTNREQWELDAIPSEVETLEARQNELAAQMSDPEVLSSANKILSIQDELNSIEVKLEKLLTRWEELESIPANPKKNA